MSIRKLVLLRKTLFASYLFLFKKSKSYRESEHSLHEMNLPLREGSVSLHGMIVSSREA